MKKHPGARRLMWAAAAVLAVPAVAGAAGGTPLLGFRTWDDPHQCPPSTYSPWHYITPALFRARAFCHPDYSYIYAQDRWPGVPLQFNPIPYKCVSVPPEPFSMDHYYPGRRLPVPPLEGCPWPPGCGGRPTPAPTNEKAPAAATRPESARPEAIPAPKPGT